ncbi:uncharacterized protein LOC133033044 isoform X1 [Cannabis sativa]|uniref:uncharacterized protein LOC133033044 isoform X1 n=1 Tax=Cannabis sativa TaxID=3483 RepID=UPI0029CA3536|nr:uncharacterized protein LOC133033044 isoform X1 [Cannabis sativa]
MLCSVPAAGKSGSNWLDRLRSIKGLPTAEDFDLDHFLTQNPNSSSSFSSSSSSSELAQLNSATTTTKTQRAANRNRKWVGAMNNVLSELFFMDGSDESSKLSGKKFPRKQTNPRIFSTSMGNTTTTVVNSNSSGVVAITASFNSDSNSLIRRRKGNVRVKRFKAVDDKEEEEELGLEKEEEEEEEELENEEKKFKGYSRSEVTVIDTSFGCWKSEKMVFRRKNVWKVMEKKCKLSSFVRKKRKVENDDVDDGDDDDDDGDGDGDGDDDLSWGAVVLEKKKVKALNSHHAINGGNQSIKPSSDEVSKGQNFRKKSREEIYKATTKNPNTTRKEISSTESPDNLSQDFRKRSRLSSSPRKMKKGGSSSVVLIKGISTGKKKNGVMVSPNWHKSTQKLHMANNNSPRK